MGFRHFNGFETLGDRIRKRRLELGLTQKELTKMFGVTDVTISKWELNFSNPEFSHLSKIYEFLGYEHCDDSK